MKRKRVGINTQEAKKFPLPGVSFSSRRNGSIVLATDTINHTQPYQIGIVDWHNYCTETVIRGDNRKKFRFQVGIRLGPRLPQYRGKCRSGKRRRKLMVAITKRAYSNIDNTRTLREAFYDDDDLFQEADYFDDEDDENKE